MVFLTCPSANVCFSEGLVGSEVALEVTHDGGASWRKLTAPAEGPPFTCVDASTCAALGNAAGGGPSGHEAFVETVNSGRSWSSLPFPGGAGYGSLSCATARACVALGSNQHGLATAMVTSDGGHTWSQFELPSRLRPPAASRFIGFSPRGLHCSTSGTCTAVGVRRPARLEVRGPADQYNAGLYSTDGGSMWGSAALPAEFNPASLSCGSASHCMAVGRTGTDPRSMSVAVAVSADAGRVWSEVNSPPGPPEAESLNGISCSTGSQCWVTGSIRGRATLAQTTDEGRSWRFALLPRGIADIESISCPDATTCYALGAQRQASGRYVPVLLSDGS